MKLALATVATTFALATGAAAMIGPYERAVDDADSASGLFTQGDSAYDKAQDRSNSPQAEWNNGEAKKLSVFSTKGSDGSTMHFGVNAR